MRRDQQIHRSDRPALPLENGPDPAIRLRRAPVEGRDLQGRDEPLQRVAVPFGSRLLLVPYSSSASVMADRPMSPTANAPKRSSTDRGRRLMM